MICVYMIIIIIIHNNKLSNIRNNQVEMIMCTLFANVIVQK